MTFDHVVWSWPFVKLKKDDVIRYRLLYCTLVPGMMSMGLILYEISPILCLFYVTFNLHLRPSAFVKVTCILFILCTLCCWMFVPKMKLAGSVEYEIWTFVYIENLNDVTLTSPYIWFQWISLINLHRAYASCIPNFRLIEHTRAVGKVTENYEEKNDFEQLWPWPLT